MANPNIVNVANIYGITSTTSSVGTDLVGILTNTSGSGKVLKVNTIIAANVSAGSSAVSISFTLVEPTNQFTHLVKNIYIPAYSSQIISAKDTSFYLQENVGICAQGTLTDGVDVIVSYEEIS